MWARPPRFGDAPRRGLPPGSAEEIARRMRRAAVLGSVVALWVLGGILASIVGGRIDPIALVLILVVPAALAAAPALWLALRAPSRVRSLVAASLSTLALVGAIAAHVLFWGGAQASLLLLGASALTRTAVFAGVLILVPLWAGTRLRALDLAWRASGSRARGPLVHLRALAWRPGDDLLLRPPARAFLRGILARWSEGLTVPGLVLMDIILQLRRPADRLHATVDLDTLADALAAEGVDGERIADALHVRLAEGPLLRLAPGLLLFPPAQSLEVRGNGASAPALRRMLEGPVAHALVFSWSAPAKRWEGRLNALHQDALAASTLEERSVVMEELDHVHHALSHRALCGEEHGQLSLKLTRTRALLAHRMLSEPPGAPAHARLVAHHAALAPELSHALDAGGLGVLRRVVFVPHWVIPTRTAFGEQEIVVSAVRGHVDLAESRALLDAMARRAPAVLLDAGTDSTFLTAPAATAALLRALRASGVSVLEEVVSGEIPPDIVHVPYIAVEDGYASGITGHPADDLGPAMPVVAV